MSMDLKEAYIPEGTTHIGYSRTSVAPCLYPFHKYLEDGELAYWSDKSGWARYVTKVEDVLKSIHLKEVAMSPAPSAVPSKPRIRLPSQLQKQEGGSHYKSIGIQPVEYAHANNLDFFQASAVKYITRHKTKNGVEDIKKCIHFLQFILELQYGVNSRIEYQDKGDSND
jgi:hypothetical protein